MKLRDSVRPPQPYGSELFYQPTPQRPLRRGRTPAPPTYIDFNPNLPPAAFPTLKDPRPAGDTQNQVQGQNKQTEDRDGDFQMSDAPISRQNARPQHANTEMDDELEGILMESIDNYLASNGPQNTIYAENMAMLAESSQASMSTDDDDIEKSEGNGEDHNHAQSTDRSPLPDPEWGDLSPRLQVEIVENMLHTHPWPKIVPILGLTDEESEKIRNHIVNHNKQVEQENAQLKEMRAKQLKALMRIDNSALKLNRVPHQLVFRKTSRQYSRKLRESIASDYLLCQAGEFLGARRFLRKRGLDPRYAGEWGNDMVVLRKSPDEPDLETFEWRDDAESDSQTLVTPTPTVGRENAHGYDEVNFSTTPRMDNDALQTQVVFINGVGMAGTVDPAELQIRKGDLSSPCQKPTTNLAAVQPSPRRHGILRLKIGAERAAQIRDSENLSGQTRQLSGGFTQTWNQPTMKSNKREFDGCSPMGVNSSLANPQERSSGELSQGPVRRAMGGQWSYDSIERNVDTALTSSARLRQKLEEARVEAQRERVEIEATREQNDQNGAPQFVGLQSALLSRDLQIREQHERPPAPSVGEAFFESCPELVAKARAFALNMPPKMKEAQRTMGGSIASPVLKQVSTHNIPIDANEPDHGPEYSPLTPPLRLNFSIGNQGQEEQGALAPFVQKPEWKGTEDHAQEITSTEETKQNNIFLQSDADHEQANTQKYDRDGTPEIKENLANVPLHSEAAVSNQAGDPPHPVNSDCTKEKQTNEEKEPTITFAVEVPVPAPVKLILRHGKQQLRSVPDSRRTMPELTGSMPETENPQSGFNCTESEMATQPQTNEGSHRRSTPAPSTKQKAPAKKTPSSEPTRRSERLNGPPNQRMLRKRNGT